MIFDAKRDEFVKKPAKTESGNLGGLRQQTGCGHSRDGVGFQNEYLVIL
jgi:hypothetical protein